MAASDDLVLWDPSSVATDVWHTNAAGGSTSRLSVEDGARGAALRFDFKLVGHGAWTIARRELAATLPAHYAVVLCIRGHATPAELQFKLVDPSGANVWWWRRHAFQPPPATQRVVLRKASLEFAWGPASGGDPERIAAVELAFAADEGAEGTIWIEELRIEARDPDVVRPTVNAVAASSAAPGHQPARILDGDSRSSWQPDAGDAEPWIQVDLGRKAEWGGLIADFARTAVAGRLLASDDGQQWTPVAAGSASGSRLWLRAEGEGRFLRLVFARGGAPVLVRVAIAPIELAVSPARYCAAVARRAPRGRYPRHLLGEQVYWALVGADGDERKGLLSEDGALEVDAESFSIEPFLWTGDRLLTWADVDRRLSLADDHLPVPSVIWEVPELRVHITAFAYGAAGRSALVARYVIENPGAGARRMRFFVALRPFQVNPAWQSLNLVGGIAPIVRLERAGDSAHVNARHTLVAVTPPDAFGAARSEEGLAALAQGRVPGGDEVDDPIGFAEGALAFDVSLPPGGCESVVVTVPLGAETPLPPSGLDRAAAVAWAEERLAETISQWRARLARIPIELPPSAEAVANSLRASLAWILINREGPRIQPGPRCYRRSWIRDGTLTGTALAEMGFVDELRGFLRWYAPYQLPDGRVPCAIDRRGIDQAVEHDSHGQLVWGVVEVYRLTGDLAFLRELWPHVLKAVDAIAALRAQRTGDDRRGDPSFGLLPESISHEGYASRPVHAYWDDFFAVRALADAAFAAGVLRDGEASARIGTLRDAMREDLRGSIERTIARHGIDFLPGSVELGDFDPSSSAIVLDPCGAGALVPAAALRHTFDRYWAEFDARRRGDKPADAYAPYEVRNAAALILLGQKPRALELLEWLIADQRPVEWRQWPEVAWRDRRAPRFFGDLPHGWVASTFVRTVRRMFAYERADDDALVLAAGVPAAWIRQAPGVRVRNLPTHFGPLDYTMLAEADDRVRVCFGDNLPSPPGGIVIVSPLDRPLDAVYVDGRSRPVEATDRVVLRAPATEVILS